MKQSERDWPVSIENGLVSIMMPLHNAERYLNEAIRSVLSQTYATWELVAVNDGSTDRTTEILGELSDPRIRVIHQPENSGEGAARNTALENMRGEFVAFLDGDDEFLPSHVEVAVDYLAKHPNYDAVYTDGHYCTQEGRTIQTLSSRRIGPFDGQIFEHVARTSSVLGPPLCVVLRRETVVRNDLRFDPTLAVGTDWDFFTHFAELGQFGYIEDCTCLYRVHENNISTQSRLSARLSAFARCRTNAIRLESFGCCSVESKAAIFYDLLVNLLRASPQQQQDTTAWPQFLEMPRPEQARLLRLMASRAIVDKTRDSHIEDWLRRACMLQPTSLKPHLLRAVYSLSPSLCRFLLCVKNSRQDEPSYQEPLADLVGSG